ncbi:maleylpyruvate isomerase family mycothiol-dependent enzyme [Nitriliruptor alkaliphilus]|uniref:maleylpyruvate isomerase family mycothiol-dependent enzyme n=1 Tax=Nitriliruptor alkaliphilus TaxID=427918 RepID=UPI0006970967|nr:maleylpyruvate isomerase family mycothiol-dependent enzyme [Nitriliruptor alkaliphilus]
MTPTTGSLAVSDIRRIGRGDDAATLATAVYERLFELLDRLRPDDWARPTDCAGWDVDDIVGHLLGAAEGHASPREALRQSLRGWRERSRFDGSTLDAMNDLQVREHAHLSPEEKVTALRAVVPAAVRTRAGLPGLVRAIPFPIPAVGSMPSGLPTRVTVGQGVDTLITRDVLMHRIDIARAADLDPALGGEADRRLVADIVAEWAQRHGQPVVLHLTGPAGGTYHQHDGGPSLELDAAEFCRVVSGRATGAGLLATHVLF